ncbi:hypothetical protein NUACC26_034620 [Scytonema sp. NUACC26]
MLNFFGDSYDDLSDVVNLFWCHFGEMLELLC